MSIRIWKKDTITCEDCILKHTCDSSKCAMPEGAKVRPCNYCTQRCENYDTDEREEQFGCTCNTCLFELDSKEC